MKAGTMDRRITIQSKNITFDTAGSEVVTWSDVATVWCDVEDVASSAAGEKTEDKQLTASQKTTFTIRYRTDVTLVDQIIYESKTYDINGITELGRRDGLALDAKYRDNT